MSASTDTTNHMITTIDPANKHNTFVFTRDFKPAGWIHCFCKTEWQAFDANGKFINWFPSKKAALAALS